jgi:hypothetical protein
MAYQLPPYPMIAVTDDPKANALWIGWFERVRAMVNNDVLGTAWTNITSTPTTITGYGITDAYTKIQTDDARITSMFLLMGA